MESTISRNVVSAVLPGFALTRIVRAHDERENLFAALVEKGQEDRTR
jgi:hypothetical protein